MATGLVLVVICLVAFLINRNYLKEGALTKAQQYSNNAQKEQQNADDLANIKKINDKNTIKTLGYSPSSPAIAPAMQISPAAGPGGFNYDANNLNNYSSIRPELRGSEKEAKQTQFDIDLKLLDPYPVYYEPGSFPFSSTGYIPNYEDSVYLSKTTKLSQIGVIKQAPYLQGGFCTQFAKDNLARNEKCGTLDQATCASTNCCILMGGTKCVAGDANGPSLKTVYSDVTIPNRDYWYYQGKCSGNCP